MTNIKGTIKHWFRFDGRVRGVMKADGEWKVITTSLTSHFTIEDGKYYVSTISGSTYLLDHEIDATNNDDIVRYWPQYNGSED